MKANRTLRVRDCMSIDPMTVGPKDSLQNVINLLRRRDVRSVPVLEKGRLIGIVTDRDVREVAPAYPLFRHEDEIRPRYLWALLAGSRLWPTRLRDRQPRYRPDPLLPDGG